MEQPTRSEELGPSTWRYEAILPHCRGKNVFDFGCGSGHGSRMLAEVALSVQAWERTTEVYQPRKGVTFTETPEDVGIITAVEVIEHIEKEEVRSLLKEWSVKYPEIALTTPNGDLFPYQPKTPADRRGYHVWHYTRDELISLFKEYYSFVTVEDIIWDGVLEKFTAYKVFCSRL